MLDLIFKPNRSATRQRSSSVGVVAFLSGLLLLAVVCAPVALAKGKPDPGGPGLKLTIQAVFLTDPFAIDDGVPEKIEIIGLEFDPGDDCQRRSKMGPLGGVKLVHFL